MDPLSPLAQRILRFSGVQPQVLRQLEADRLKKDSRTFFGEDLDVDVYVKKAGNGLAHTGIVELATNKNDSRALAYGSGFIRNLHRMLTGEDLPPTEVSRIRKEYSNGDIFERAIGSDN